MSDLIGPGLPCWTCGGVYGQHKPNCQVPAERRAARDAADARVGQHILDAIVEHNALELGRAIREAIHGHA